MAHSARLATVVIATLLLVLASISPVAAQSVSGADELKQLVPRDDARHVADDDLYGGRFDPYTGEVEFTQTDASLAGSSALPVQITRTFRVGDPRPTSRTSAFADWDLDLPRITTLVPKQNGGFLWQVDGADPLARCSNFGPPPTATVGSTTSSPDEWWRGYQLVLPGQEPQEVMARSAANTTSPAPFAADPSLTFPLVTKGQWQISCRTSTSSGDPGEAFLAVSPDGTLYWFNYLVYQWAPSITLPSGDVLERSQASFLVAKMQDRFGNTVMFNYTVGQLTSITSSDGRTLQISYLSGTPFIQKVTLQPASAQPRVWTYNYAGVGSGHEQLTSVVLPDGSSWDLSGMQALDDASVMYASTGGSCDVLPDVANGGQQYVGSMRHPSGLTASFTFAPTRHGRSYVSRNCTTSTYPWIPREFDTLSLVRKQYSGANVPNYVWQYRYGPANASWSTDCSTACATTTWTEIVDPGSSVTRYTFNNRFDAGEGQLLRVDQDAHYDTAGTLTGATRVEVFAYADPAAGPYPTSYGNSLTSRTNNERLTRISPLSSHQIVEEGDTYQSQVLAFNAFAQPTDIRRSNTIAGQTPFEETLTYVNDLPHWVLGLLASETNASDGTVITQSTYDLSNVTLKEQYRFGQKLLTYAYTSAGLLSSVTDGNAHTTSFSNYKLGTPQTVTYADQKSETRAVDDFGQVTSITDPTGATFGYTYDAVGRQTKVTYPTGDTVAWNATNTTYAYVTSAERGVAAGHWRETTTRGNATRVIFYDALMRPVLTDTYDAANSATHVTVAGGYNWRNDTVFASYPASGALALSQLTAGVSTDYDALGRVIRSRQDSELGQLTTSITYLTGARRQVTDPKGKTTTFSYQVFDAPAYDAITQVQAPETVTQTIVRNVYGLPVSITQSGIYQTASVSLTRQHFYDSYMRLCRIVEPEAGSRVIDYDGANNVLWTASGQTIAGSDCGRTAVADTSKTKRTYDARDRVLMIDYPGSTADTSYTYDADGRIATAVAGSSTTNVSYAKRGLLTKETLSLDGYQWSATYAYDTNGSLASTTYPDGRIVDYNPNALGQATKAGTFATLAQYSPNGVLTYFKYSNGIEYLAEENARLATSNVTYSKPGGVLAFSQDLSYDANGNLLTATDLATSGQRNQSYSYDGLNRLASATATGLWGTETYTYDPLDNLRTLTDSNGTQQFVVDAFNRLTSIQTPTGQSLHTYTYDSRGNASIRDGVSLSFDDANRLALVANKENYAYDAFGHRVYKADLAGGGKTYFMYSASGTLLYEYDNAARVTRDYIYLSGTLVARVERYLVDTPGNIWFVPASPTNGTYAVWWGGVPHIDYYQLQEQANGGAWTTVYQGTNSKYDGFPQKQGGAYNYRVRACEMGQCSNWVMSVTMGVTPSQPTITVPTGTQTTAYRISWTTPTSTTGFDVEEQKDGGTWTRLATNTTATYIDRPGTVAGNYAYRVEAKNAFGTRGWVTSPNVAVNPINTSPPLQPATVTAPRSYWGNLPANLTISWTAVDRATRYEVLRANLDTGATSTVCSTSSLSCVNSVTAYALYQYSARACNSYGCSAWKAAGNTTVVDVPLR